MRSHPRPGRNQQQICPAVLPFQAVDHPVLCGVWCGRSGGSPDTPLIGRRHPGFPVSTPDEGCHWPSNRAGQAIPASKHGRASLSGLSTPLPPARPHRGTFCFDKEGGDRPFSRLPAVASSLTVPFYFSRTAVSMCSCAIRCRRRCCCSDQLQDAISRGQDWRPRRLSRPLRLTRPVTVSLSLGRCDGPLALVTSPAHGSPSVDDQMAPMESPWRRRSALFGSARPA